MLLAIDVGNTNIEIGLFRLSDQNEHKIVNSFRCSTNRSSTTDEIGSMFKSFLFFNQINCSNIKAIICSSVVPPLNHSLIRMSTKYFNCNAIFVNHKLNTGLKFAYINPAEIGADRIVNAVAVSTIYKGPAVVVDFGTATTFCLISDNNEYLGGIIASGMQTSLDALTQKAAKLPKIELSIPSSIIGKSTHDGMLSGTYYGTISLVEGMVRKIKDQAGIDNLKIVATGGLSNFVSQGTDIFDIVDNQLTLKGLNILYHLNK